LIPSTTSSPTPTSSPTSNKGVIAGATIGGICVALLLAALVGVFFYFRRRISRLAEKQDGQNSGFPSEQSMNPLEDPSYPLRQPYAYPSPYPPGTPGAVSVRSFAPVEHSFPAMEPVELSAVSYHHDAYELSSTAAVDSNERLAMSPTPGWESPSIATAQAVSISTPTEPVGRLSISTIHTINGSSVVATPSPIGPPQLPMSLRVMSPPSSSPPSAISPVRPTSPLSVTDQVNIRSNSTGDRPNGPFPLTTSITRKPAPDTPRT
jgi:hypothetical protein